MRDINKTHRVVTGITERKQREAEMAWLAQFPGENPNPVLRIDRDGIICYGNKASGPLLETWGCREGEHIPDRWHHIVLETLSSRRVQQAECKCGSRVLALTFVPVGEATCVHLYALDVTDHKRAEEASRLSEEALRQHHDQLQAIFEGMIEGLVITDIETKRFMRVNASLCRMLGYSEEELLAASLSDIHPPEETADDLARFQAAAEGRVSINEDRPVLRKDGSIFYADITGRRIMYQGRPCLLALFRDVTERRRAQAALQRERRTLKHMLHASDHERQLIAYDIHDGLAQQVAGAIMQLQVYEHLRQIDAEEAQRAYDGGVTLLRQSHFEARRLISGVRPPILDEAGVLAAIAHLASDYSVTGRLRIVFHSNVKFKRLAAVLENVIYRIVQECLTNASRHSQSDVVRVTLRQHGSKLRIEIQDWGTGFDPRTAQGRGFGLSGIRERARLLGGKCRIHSQPGQGTRIVVDLPLAKREAERKADAL